jgi:hypothetical protein
MGDATTPTREPSSAKTPAKYKDRKVAARGD